MPTYEDLNLNSKLQNLNSLLNKRQFIRAIDFDTQYEVQQKQLRVTRISNFISNTGTASASGSVTNNSSVTVTTTATSTGQFLGQRNFCFPFVAVYQGTAQDANFQVYPRFGGSVVGTQYSCHGAFDYQGWNGTNSVFRMNITNTSGTTQNIFAITQWKAINQGTFT